MKHLRPRSLFCLSLMLVFGCKNITHVQTGYVSDRDECRAQSENNVGVYNQPDSYPLSDKDRNGALLQLFCECMKDRDWRVAGCPKPPTAVAQTPAPAQPTVVVVQSPTAQPAIMPVAEPASAPAPVTVKAKKKKPKVCLPPTVCPAPSSYIDGSPNQTPAQGMQQLDGLIQRQ